MKINSLVTHRNCIFRSWNIAANDNHLWEMQYVALFGYGAKLKHVRLVEGKKNRLLQETVDNRPINWKDSVKRAYTGKLNVEEMYLNSLFFHIQYVLSQVIE